MRRQLFPFVALVVLLMAMFAGASSSVAQQECSSPEDWLKMKNSLLSVSEDARESVYAQFSPQCQDYFMKGMELAPGYTIEQSESLEQPRSENTSADASLASTCKTTTYTATKHTALGFVAYKFHAHLYRCYDGSSLTAPTMWTTFSEVDGLMQVQSYVDEYDYWYSYPWRYDVYEQRQVKNCIWTGCLATYYPTASGWMTGSGSTYLEISGG